MTDTIKVIKQIDRSSTNQTVWVETDAGTEFFARAVLVGAAHLPSVPNDVADRCDADGSATRRRRAPARLVSRVAAADERLNFLAR